MTYTSTRNSELKINSCQCLLDGISSDGGLYVPSDFPVVDAEKLRSFAEMTYAELAAEILSLYIDLDKTYLLKACEKAYSRFDDGDPAPIIKIDNRLFICELWHGPTAAFKDLALTVFPDLLFGAQKALNNTDEILILTATSGDTGKAALESFRDKPGARVMVFFPGDGVSPMQRLQMTSQLGLNVNVVAVKGNFDDTQNSVKDIFSNKTLAADLTKRGIRLTGANSINIGRLAPQIAYYFYTYVSMCESGELAYGTKINFSVPSGNFGNVLAGWYAKRMGLPIDKLICASNRNCVLTDFLTTGTYTSRRSFYKTSSPSMDILVSSNVERLIFELSGRNSALTAQRMIDLKKTGTYSLAEEERTAIAKDFLAYSSDETVAHKALFHTFDEYGYIVDPHTAIGFSAFYQHYKETRDKTKTVVLSTANPYKFSGAVLTALKKKPTPDEFDGIRRLHTLTALPIPKEIAALEKAPVRFTDLVTKGEALAAVKRFAFDA